MIKQSICALISLLLSSACCAQSVAVTIDNPNTYKKPLISDKARDKSILGTLKKHHVKAILFVQGEQVDNAPGRALLQRWQDEGHWLGNHTYSHLSLNDTPEHELEGDTLRNEMLLSHYENFHKIFRFPFLKEGDTEKKRDEFRLFLAANDYKNGSVTIDTSDWYISDRLEERLAKNPAADIRPYEKYYLKHVFARAQYYDKLARKVLGRSPKHVLLLHHNLLNALFLDDLLTMFEQKGWKIIDANVAYDDPVYQLTPETIPAGESLIWALAKQTGKYDKPLRYPGEDASYEKGAMDKANL